MQSLLYLNISIASKIDDLYQSKVTCSYNETLVYIYVKFTLKQNDCRTVNMLIFPADR